MWPTGLAAMGIDLRGKIAEGAEEGRAVARLTDLGHGQALRDLFRPGAGDTPVPAGLARALVAVLMDWQPHVDGIVVVESVRRPTLTADLADNLARFLKKPLVGRYAVVDSDVEPERGQVNSAQRVAAVGRRFALELDEPYAAPGALEGRTVLLVDDQTVTGWTLTRAAVALRARGAERVLPLVLGLG